MRQTSSRKFNLNLVESQFDYMVCPSLLETIDAKKKYEIKDLLEKSNKNKDEEFQTKAGESVETPRKM